MSYPVFRKKIVSVGALTGLLTATAIVVITACTDKANANRPNFVYKEPPKPGVVAKIGDKEYTEDSLIGDDKLDFFELKKREYDLKMDRLNKLMINDLIGAEAKKANMSLDDYINKKITGDIKISDKEYKKFVAEKHIPESQINPQIKERIMAYLQGTKKQDLINAHIAKLTKSNPVEVYFNKPKMEIDVEAGQAPVMGNKDAPITVIEFSDLQCPFCSRGAETVAQLKKKYGNKIQVAFRHFPLPMHQQAKPAAEASMCVNEQGTDKFWKFHDLAFKNQDKLDKANLEKYAKEAGADVKKFNECVESKKYADYVQKDMEYGEKVGVKSTPTFIFKVTGKKTGEVVNGAVPLETMSEKVDELLAESKK